MSIDSIHGLTITARTIRARVGDREEARTELDEAVDTGPASLDLLEAYRDLNDHTVDDLCLLLEQVEALKSELASLAADAELVADMTPTADTSPTAVSRQVAATASTTSQVPGGERAGTIYSTGFRSDFGLQDADVEFVEPATVFSAITSSWSGMASSGSVPGPITTLSVTVAVDSAEYRAMFDPKPGQLVISARGTGDRLAAFHTTADMLLYDDLMDLDSVPAVVALINGSNQNLVTVVSGQVTGMTDNGAQTMIEFADGAAVAYYDVTALRLG